MSIITRFAPSPTGLLHLGGARTALFNWLYARHHAGEFRLRIEDTDQARSNPQIAQNILDDLQWLGLSWDGEVVYQSARIDRHREVALSLLESGHAYRCYATPEELDLLRSQKKGYDRRWRDRPASEAPAHVQPVIRLKAPLDGISVIDDRVQGRVQVKNTQLDDFVLLRADGTPTYMLSVVADDHDMEVTHVIRGDDHLNNAFRQTQLFRALGWDVPVFAHIPLIHDADGKKLSKRQGGLDVGTLREEGYLAEAVCNYLLRLGWSHGNDEIISREQAIEWFGLEGIGRSPARHGRSKLVSLNRHYIRNMPHDQLITQMRTRFWNRVSRRFLSGPTNFAGLSVKELACQSPEEPQKRMLLLRDMLEQLGEMKHELQEMEHEGQEIEHALQEIDNEGQEIDHEEQEIKHWGLEIEYELQEIERLMQSWEFEQCQGSWERERIECLEQKIKHRRQKVERWGQKIEHRGQKVEHWGQKVEHRRQKIERLELYLKLLQPRVSTLRELDESLMVYQQPSYDEKSKLWLRQAPELLIGTHKVLTDLSDDWLKEPIERAVRGWTERKKYSMKSVAQTMRAALTGRLVSPPIFEVAELLGRERTLDRLDQKTLAPVIAQ